MSQSHHLHQHFKAANAATGPSPLPTPPTSSVNIPPKCFPSPTSVADLATDTNNNNNNNNNNNIHHHTNNNNNSQQKNSSDSISLSQHQNENHFIQHTKEKYYFPNLVNTNPTPPMNPVNNITCLRAAQDFAKFDQQNPNASDQQLIQQIRILFDHIDALSEQSQMEMNNLIYKTLSKPKCLSLLPILLADVSTHSSHQFSDIRKRYRYSSVATTILDSALPQFREKLLSHQSAIQHIFSFFDDQVYKLEYLSNDHSLQLARNDPTILSAVVKILVTYTETSPDTIINLLQNRSQFIPSVTSLLYMPFVSQVITSFLPDHCVDDVNRMDWAAAQFDNTMTNALSLLANNQIYHLLSNQFVQAAQNIYDLSNKTKLSDNDKQSISQSQVIADSICQLYVSLVNKTIRAIRVNPKESSCTYLNLFANQYTAKTFGVIIQAGIELFSATNCQQSSMLESSLKLMSEVFQNIQQDKERRVTSVKGQPPSLNMSAIEEEIMLLLEKLIDILLDILQTRSMQHMGIRLSIMEIITDCTAVCSENIMTLLDQKRIGEIFWKVMIGHSKHSMIHHVVMRCTEIGLVSESSTETSKWHWMIKCDLIGKIIKVWNDMDIDDTWNHITKINNSPFISAVIHIACCVNHWLAMETIDPLTLGHESSHNSISNKGIIPGRTYQKLLELDRLEQFHEFAEQVLRPICEQEKPLGGVRPQKPSTRTRSGIGGRSLSFSGLSGPLSRRQGGPLSGTAQLVPSLSAHRFGYVPPTREGLSKVDFLFSDSEDDFGTGSCSFASIFGGADALE